MSLPDPSAHRGEIKALTSLRGIAALAVVLQHFSATAEQASTGWIPSLVPHGYIAVDFFFVLSGFIMAYTYLAGFETLGWRAYLPFLWKRIARIVPLGIAMTAIFVMAAAIGSFWGKSWLFIVGTPVIEGLNRAIILNILHLQGFFPEYNLNDPSWSVSVEFGAYLLFPVLIALLIHGRVWTRVLFVLAYVGVLATVSELGGGNLGFRAPPLDLARCVVEFGVGMLVYAAYSSASPLKSIGDDRWTWAVTAVSVLLFCLRVDLLIALSFPFVVLAYALNRGRPARLLASRIPYFLGTISFSLYLVHHILRRPGVVLAMDINGGRLSQPQALAFALLGSLAVIPFATLAFYAIERPGRTVLNSLLRRLRRKRLSPA